VAFISGYTKVDSGWNVFYHKAIAESVSRTCPDSQIHKIAEYRKMPNLSIDIRYPGHHLSTVNAEGKSDLAPYSGKLFCGDARRRRP
jgi:hypothetical protein